MGYIGAKLNQISKMRNLLKLQRLILRDGIVLKLLKNNDYKL